MYNRRLAQYYPLHPSVTRFERMQFFNPTPKGQPYKPREYWQWFGLNWGDSWEGTEQQAPLAATSSGWGRNSGWPAKVLNLGSSSDVDMIELQNLSYSRLQSKIKRASLGVTVAEGREALTLMAQRAGQLYQSFKHLRKGRFGDFLRELKVRPLKKHERTKWTKPKHAASIWLEYWFGWAPLVGDIDACVDVLTSAPPPLILSGSATMQIAMSGVVTGNPLQSYQCTGKAVVKQYAKVRIENPNALLRQQAGLTNAAEIAWAIVPFSFLVDWFGNVGDVLRARTDFSGLVIEEAYATAHCKLRSAQSHAYNAGMGPWYRKWSGMNQQVCTRRILGIVGPSLQFKLPERLSVTRAATAISLLVSLFTKG